MLLPSFLTEAYRAPEVGDGTEEDAAQQDPQQNGQPAESGSLDGTGDRACTGNGAELVGEHRPTVGGNIVPAILMDNSRGVGGGPLFFFSHRAQTQERTICFFLLFFSEGASAPPDEAGPQGVKKPSSIRKIFLGRKIFPEDEGSHIHCTLWMILLRGTTSLAVGGQPLPRMAHLPCCPVTGAGRRCITQDGQGPVHTRCLQGGSFAPDCRRCIKKGRLAERGCCK